VDGTAAEAKVVKKKKAAKLVWTLHDTYEPNSGDPNMVIIPALSFGFHLCHNDNIVENIGRGRQSGWYNGRATGIRGINGLLWSYHRISI
jgi:hypothetical protein